MISGKKIYIIQDNFFNLFIISSWILIFVSILGFSNTMTKYLEEIDYYVRIYTCLFLMWRFNPFRTHYEFTNLDRKIAFNAGLFILTTSILKQYLSDAKNKFKEIII